MILKYAITLAILILLTAFAAWALLPPRGERGEQDQDG